MQDGTHAAGRKQARRLAWEAMMVGISGKASSASSRSRRSSFCSCRPHAARVSTCTALSHGWRGRCWGCGRITNSSVRGAGQGLCRQAGAVWEREVPDRTRRWWSWRPGGCPMIHIERSPNVASCSSTCVRVPACLHSTPHAQDASNQTCWLLGLIASPQGFCLRTLHLRCLSTRCEVQHWLRAGRAGLSLSCPASQQTLILRVWPSSFSAVTSTVPDLT